MNEQSKRTGVANTTYHENGTVKISVFLDIHSVVRPALLLLAGEHSTARPKQHTGLVIDARNLSFRPVLLPTFSYSSENEVVDPAETRSIRSSSGRLAGFSIGVSEFSTDTAQTKLPMIYANSPFHPEAQKRAGKNHHSSSQVHLKTVCSRWMVSPTALSSIDLKSIAARGDIVVLVDPQKLR